MTRSSSTARQGSGRAELLVLFLLASASPAMAGLFVMDVVNSLVTARMDPIISPGTISQHSHHIIGANGFTTQYQPDRIRQSNCTTVPVQDDMSNYWFPQIYQLTADGKYVGMYTGVRLYYMINEYANVEPFPYKFQMVAGDPARKRRNSSNTFDNTASYFCDFPLSGRPSFATDNFPKEVCKTLIMKIFTPSCWNGADYNAADPHAHMRYPQDSWDGVVCPRTHPRRLPVLLIEAFHATGDAAKAGLKLPAAGQPQYIFANGDTTGYGLHADMQNGWNTEVLREIIDTCFSKTSTAAEKANCSVVRARSNQDRANACRYTGNRPDESVGWDGKPRPLSALPGCNLPWSAGSKPRCNPKTSKQGRLALASRWIRTKATEKFP